MDNGENRDYFSNTNILEYRPYGGMREEETDEQKEERKKTDFVIDAHLNKNCRKCLGRGRLSRDIPRVVQWMEVCQCVVKGIGKVKKEAEFDKKRKEYENTKRTDKTVVPEYYVGSYKIVDGQKIALKNYTF